MALNMQQYRGALKKNNKTSTLNFNLILKKNVILIKNCELF